MENVEQEEMIAGSFVATERDLAAANERGNVHIVYVPPFVGDGSTLPARSHREVSLERSVASIILRSEWKRL